MKQYTLREVNTELKPTEIKIGENDLLRIYALYKKEELKENIENIIKVHIPADEEAAKTMLNEGFEFEDRKYVTLLTTVNMLKHEDKEENYSMEYFFIVEEEKDFVGYMENLASLNKLAEKEGEDLCINKDIVSRLSLLTSTGDRVYLPNLKKAILPEMTYTFINNYLQFAEENIKDNRTMPNQKLELVEYPNLSVPHTAMDGSGFIMPNAMKEIQKQLKVKYSLSWVGIREIGVASKGLLVKFDFKKYLREEHNINSLIVKDMWNNDVDLFKVDVIQNASQVKWGKWHNSAEEIEQLKLNYPEAHELLNGFNICKYNKKEPKSYTKANYQIMSNLALTPKELEEIAAEHKDIYKRVINREEHATRIMLGDIAREEELELSASTKIHRLIQLESKMLTLQSSYKVMESLVNKSIHTLAGGSIYVKGNYKVVIKDAISYFNSLINPEYIYKDGDLKAIKGYMSADGLQDKQNYVPGEIGNRTLARCPLNSATELIKTTLVKNPLYVKYFGELSSDIMFYPFNDFMMRQSGEDEDLDISLAIDNETIYNSVIEDIDENGATWYFRNQFDGGSSTTKYSKKAMYDVLLQVRGNKIGQLSNKGAIVSNLIQEMPYRTVIEDKIKYISNTQVYNNCIKYIEGKDEIIKWKKQIKNITDKDYKKEEIEKLQKTINEKVWETYNIVEKEREEKIENGNCWDYKQLKEKEIKDFIMQNFQDYKRYSYYLLYLQMVAIDQPKTNIKVDKTMEKPLFKAIGRNAKKPSYIYHAKYKQTNQVVKYSDCRSSNTLLCNFAKDVNGELGYKAREMDTDKYNNKALFKLLKNSSEKTNDDCINTLKLLEDKYHILRSEVGELEQLDKLKQKRENLGHYKKINSLEKEMQEIKYNKELSTFTKKSKRKELFKQKEQLEKEREENKTELLNTDAEIIVLNTKIKEEFIKIDLKIAEEFKETVQAVYNDKIILRSLAEVRRKDNNDNTVKASCRFILNFAFAEIEKELIEKKGGVGTMYKEDVDGEIKYLNTNYKVVPVDLVSVNLDRKETLKKKQNLGELKMIRCGFLKEVEELAGTLILKEEGKNINLYLADKNLGYIYPDLKFKEAVVGIETIEVKEVEMGKNNKSASIYF